MRQRARTLKVLKQIHTLKPKYGAEEATGMVLQRSAVNALKGTSYRTTTEQKARKRVVRKFIPTRATQAVLATRRAVVRMFAGKRKLSQQLFGTRGTCIIMVIHPELLAQAQKIKQAIKQTGAQVILSRTLILGKQGFLELYPQSFTYTKEFKTFPLFATNTQSAPNQLIVIRLPNLPEGEQREAVLKELKERLRKQFMSPFLERHGYFSGRLTTIGKTFDPTRYATTHERTPKQIEKQYTGMHIPDPEIMARNAEIFLTKKELELIAGKK